MADGMLDEVVSNSNGFHSLILFSVRRLLGSRQVVTQCLCQLNELCKVMHHSLIGGSKESMDLYEVQSPSAVQSSETERQQNKTKKNKQHHTKTQRQRRNTAVWTYELYQIAAACVPMNSILQKENTIKNITARSRRRCKITTRPASRKPRIPPARIPEITTRSPQGITGTFIHKLKQCNELGCRPAATIQTKET